MWIFRNLDLVEQLGSGVPRILKAYGKKAFQISDNYLSSENVIPTDFPLFSK